MQSAPHPLRGAGPRAGWKHTNPTFLLSAVTSREFCGEIRETQEEGFGEMSRKQIRRVSSWKKEQSKRPADSEKTKQK